MWNVERTFFARAKHPLLHQCFCSCPSYCSSQRRPFRIFYKASRIHCKPCNQQGYSYADKSWRCFGNTNCQLSQKVERREGIVIEGKKEQGGEDEKGREKRKREKEKERERERRRERKKEQTRGKREKCIHLLADSICVKTNILF
jgi:hypothetical protein